jgi:hypothetical protein
LKSCIGKHKELLSPWSRKTHGCPEIVSERTATDSFPLKFTWNELLPVEAFIDDID